jgi:aryl-alcohol dehydrogenase-like predicted oxidoreductase
MRTRLIPHTNLVASELCLGTAEFGSNVEDAVSETLIQRYSDAGGNVLDTAEVYAEWIPGGSHCSEEFLGRWLQHGFAAFPYTPQANGYFRRLETGSIAQASAL